MKLWFSNFISLFLEHSFGMGGGVKMEKGFHVKWKKNSKLVAKRQDEVQQ